MKNLNQLYSLSDEIKQLNKVLSDAITVYDIDEIPALLDGNNDKVVLFSNQHLSDILKLASHESTKENRYICVGENLDAEDRIVLLNHNVEFITPEKFSQLSDYFFQLGNEEKKQKVLMVEDDESQIMITEYILKNANFIVKSITKGEEVLDALESFDPDLILMDLYLEGVTGDKLVKIIRKVPKYRFIPIVFQTADTTEESRMQVLNAGADDLLTKPINADLLVAALRNRIERSILYQSHINKTDTFVHKVEEQEQTLLSEFIEQNHENPKASLFWFKVDNQHALLKKLGYSGFKNICSNLFQSIPSYDNTFDIRLKLTDGVYVFASTSLDRNEAKIWVEKITKWLSKNYFSVSGKDYYLTLKTIILADIPKKTDKNLLLRKAEDIMIDNMANQAITFLDEGTEEKRFYLTKMQIENAIKTRNLKWQYQTIVSTQDENQEIYQLMLRIMTNNGKELTSSDFLDTANKTGLLRVLDRFTLEHAIRLIRAGEQKKIHTRTLLNQIISDYQSEQLRVKKLRTIKNLKLPEGSLVFQFDKADAEENMSILPVIGRELQGAHIGVCLSNFDCSSMAWKIARKMHVRWIRLKPSAKNMDQARLEELKNTINKAHTLGYKVIVSKVDSAGLAANLWKLNIDYLQGNFIQAPVKRISA